MDKRFLAILGVAIAVLVGIFIFTSSKSDNASTTSSVSTSNHSVGKLDSKVELVEYGDFQCPACGQFFPLVREVKEKYKDSSILDENNLVDQLCVLYTKKRNYLKGYLSYLEQLEQEGKIEIILKKRLFGGSLYLEGYPTVIWKVKK